MYGFRAARNNVYTRIAAVVVVGVHVYGIVFFVIATAKQLVATLFRQMRAQ